MPGRVRKRSKTEDWIREVGSWASWELFWVPSLGKI